MLHRLPVTEGPRYLAFAVCSAGTVAVPRIQQQDYFYKLGKIVGITITMQGRIQIIRNLHAWLGFTLNRPNQKKNTPSSYDIKHSH